jgi:uncharacterized membrane protein YphA (DoxX/SURF4 family)
MERSAGSARISSYLSLVFRLGLGVMFLYTGSVHFLDPQGFAEAVSNYRILPAMLVNPFSAALPVIEMIAGAAFVLGISVPGASLIVAGLLFLFALALAMALFQGLDISCGCFTTSREAQRISWVYLVRDAGLLALAVFVFRFDTGLASVRRILHLKPGAVPSGQP